MDDDGLCAIAGHVVILAQGHDRQDAGIAQRQHAPDRFRRDCGIVVDKHLLQTPVEPVAVVVGQVRHDLLDLFMHAQQGIAPSDGDLVRLVVFDLVQVGAGPFERIGGLARGEIGIGKAVRVQPAQPDPQRKGRVGLHDLGPDQIEGRIQGRRGRQAGGQRRGGGDGQGFIGDGAIEVGLGQDARPRHHHDPQIRRYRVQIKAQVITLAAETTVLVHHRHRRVDRTERGAHDADPHGRNVGLDQSGPGTGEIAAGGLVLIGKGVACGDDHAAEGTVAPIRRHHAQACIVGLDVQNLGRLADVDPVAP